MKKHKVVVCTGTLCHVLGGSELPSLGQRLPEEWRGLVDIKGSPCMGYCKDSEMHPPFVEIDGEVMQEASVSKVLEYLEKRIGHGTK
ncbi:MAG: hypothetical protein WC951_06105 [Bacteroidales bacterium]|nr:NAD(P)H-dependent oxidoreductase subunit E [Tenuifilaceae bacterium]